MGPIASIAEDLARNPLQWGPFRVVPAASYRFSYSTRLPYGGFGGAGEETIQHTVAPSLTLQSTHLTLSYSPSLTYYMKGRFEDSLKHSASLLASFGFEDWRFGISHSYATASQVLVETSAQTDTESHNTGLTAAYRLSDKTSIDLTASQSIRDTSSFNSSKTWSTMNWIDCQVTDITRIGVGAGGGYTAVDLGSDMTYEQFQGRVNWTPRPKLSASLNGGIEIRQFLAQQGASDQVNPIMGATAAYRPFETTSLSLTANRGVSSSIFTDQISETTSFSLHLAQSFFEHLQAGLGGGVRFVDYQSSSKLSSVDRSDEVTFYSATLGTRLFRRASLSVSYSHLSNNSNLPSRSFDSDTYSAQISYSF